MCGISGWVSYDRDLSLEGMTLEAMTEPMACRGPDAAGSWLNGHAAFGHRRLAVIDIAGGTQPMTVERDGRTVLVTTYSGEVHNHRELRAELEGLGHVFRTSGDTEVVLHACLQWGDDFAGRLNGMYAFALWDPRDQEPHTRFRSVLSLVAFREGTYRPITSSGPWPVSTARCGRKSTPVFRTRVARRLTIIVPRSPRCSGSLLPGSRS